MISGNETSREGSRQLRAQVSLRRLIGWRDIDNSNSRAQAALGTNTITAQRRILMLNAFLPIDRHHQFLAGPVVEAPARGTGHQPQRRGLSPLLSDALRNKPRRGLGSRASNRSGMCRTAAQSHYGLEYPDSSGHCI
jgi:hypothetical protein